jgi:hypothetical protein
MAVRPNVTGGRLSALAAEGSGFAQAGLIDLIAREST